MATTATLTQITYGAPVVIVEGSLKVHLPSVYRLGRGTLYQPISYYIRRGTVPLKWSTMCGLGGVVVFNRGQVFEAEPCARCQRQTLDVS